MNRMLKWLHYILTDQRNQWDIGILMWLWYCGIFGWRAMTASTFDLEAFGVGSAGVLAGGAGLRWILTKIPEAPEEK